jgi:hypothetical protein
MIISYKGISKLLCLSLFWIELLAATGEVPLAEEGSRYHGTLKAVISYKTHTLEYDFWNEHSAMASIISSDADDGQYSSLVRFHSIFINKDDKLEVGQTVYLTSPDLLLSSVTQQPTYEVGFASGEYNSKTQDPSMKFSSVYALILSDTVSKRDLLTLRPALHKTKVDGCVTNKFPIRFMMCNYVDPGVLRRQLEHRYVNIDRSIIASSGSNVRAIVDPHTEVISAIVESRKRTRDLLLKMADTVQEDATLAVLEANRSALEATNAPNSTPKANSYNCAEQCQFVYLQDARVMNYLRQRLDVSNPNFVGLVVSAHCSHTPCHSCMTSFTREAETGGVFSVIVNGKPYMYYVPAEGTMSEKICFHMTKPAFLIT